MEGIEVRHKKPWLAALLNIVLTGLGYIYVGRRKVFGVLLLVGEILVLIFADEEALLASFKNVWPVSIGVILFAIAFALDAYNDAKET